MIVLALLLLAIAVVFMCPMHCNKALLSSVGLDKCDHVFPKHCVGTAGLPPTLKEPLLHEQQPDAKDAEPTWLRQAAQMLGVVGGGDAKAAEDGADAWPRAEIPGALLPAEDVPTGASMRAEEMTEGGAASKPAEASAWPGFDALTAAPHTASAPTVTAAAPSPANDDDSGDESSYDVVRERDVPVQTHARKR